MEFLKLVEFAETYGMAVSYKYSMMKLIFIIC